MRAAAAAAAKLFSTAGLQKADEPHFAATPGFCLMTAFT
jgi:hypothetical protein